MTAPIAAGEGHAVALVRELLRNRALAYARLDVLVLAGPLLAPLAAASYPGGEVRFVPLGRDPGPPEEVAHPPAETPAERAGRASGGRWTLLLLEAPSEAVLAALPAADETVIVGAGSVSGHGRTTVIAPGAPAGRERTVIVVEGTGIRSPAGDHVLTPAALHRLRTAERLARRLDPVAVVLTGFSGWTDGPSEAEQLRRAWDGPPVPLLLDEAARSTAENAIFCAPLVRAIGGIETVWLTSTWWNTWRIGLFFTAALRRSGIRLRLRVTVRGGPHLRMVAIVLSGLPRLRDHWRAGRAFRRHGFTHPDALPYSMRAPQRR